MVLKLAFSFCMKVVLCMYFVLKCYLSFVIRRAIIFIVIFVISIPDLVETICCVRLLKIVNFILTSYRNQLW